MILNVEHPFLRWIAVLRDVGRILRYVRLPPPRLPERTSDTAVIIGLGPSLTRTMADWERLRHCDCFAMNGFACTEWYAKVQPRSFFMADPLYRECVAAYPARLPERAVEHDHLDALIESTTWPLTLFTTWDQRTVRTKLVPMMAANPNIRVISYSCCALLGALRYRFCRWRLGILGGTTVLQSVANVAIQMGYPQIYLCGADHDWVENVRFDEDVKRSYFEDVHCYPGKPRYYFGFSAYVPQPLYESLCHWSRMFYDYYDLAELARRQSTVIYNASVRSYISAFEFRDIPDVPTHAAQP